MNELTVTELQRDMAHVMSRVLVDGESFRVTDEHGAPMAIVKPVDTVSVEVDVDQLEFLRDRHRDDSDHDLIEAVLRQHISRVEAKKAP